MTKEEAIQRLIKAGEKTDSEIYNTAIDLAISLIEKIDD